MPDLAMKELYCSEREREKRAHSLAKIQAVLDVCKLMLFEPVIATKGCTYARTFGVGATI
jgi:hypothetical protein